jgi:hypothetical protein
LLNWTLLFRKIAATETLLPVLLSCYCQNRGKKKEKKDGNYEITTTTNSMQTGKKRERKKKKKKTGNSHLSESPLLML